MEKDPPSSESLKVLIHPLAVAKIIRHAASHPSIEIAGFLIGYFINHDTTVITDTRTGRQTGNSVHVVIDDIELAKIAEELDSSNIGEKIVGWYHSHPHMGAHFFSSTDIDTQRKYQMFSPQTVGFVIDTSEYLRSGNIEDIDLRCWRVDNRHSISIDYHIISDPQACLRNLLLHLMEGIEIDSTVSRIMGSLIPSLEQIPQYNTLHGIKLETAEVVDNGIFQKNILPIKIVTQSIILSTFIILTLLFLAAI
ncbi:MAG: Mov34/MPN/PAD-1 family protein [Candidatus Helarchaeota archaeon]